MSLSRQSFQLMAQAIRNNDTLPEKELLLQVEEILRTDPEVVHERGNGPGPDGNTLLHLAALHRSPELCKLFIGIDGDLVRAINDMGELPFHCSCYGCNTETAKYLYSLYPEINKPNNSGFYPLHTLLSYEQENDITELTEILVKCDKGALSTPARTVGILPLHFACYDDLTVIKLVYDAYPEAIHRGDIDERTPLDWAIRHGNHDVVSFFETQLHYVRQGEVQLAPDEYGDLPIHKAVLDEGVSVGTIKLIVEDDPNCVMEVNNRGSTPLHLACQVGHLDVVKYLITTCEESLQICNSSGEIPLQVACRYGKCNIINYMLEKSDHGVSTKNAEKKLPIQVLLFDAECNRDSLEFVEAVGRLLFAYPVNPADLAKKDDQETENKEPKKRKRAFTNTNSVMSV
eukprot:scaffold51847_cov39-Cyclotella_meneghiniana.AAC.5